ncbi:MAG: metalloregulator ArsR/SmtB family transcription factor [Akkermansiaceae bacterium]|nr:metalloregulator ArsR/SmtB family transcription factor [Akkermansiaceae bacterium]NNM28280.1 metalloregulator ArsR/SmtB family transcription factor [Akkermansiaceae bacterium]
MASILKSLKLIADPTRLRLLILLAAEALSVAELQEILGMGQSRISTQLAQLKKEGLVANHRSGKNNIYAGKASGELLDIATKAARELPEAKKDAAALKHVLRKRKDKTRAYFDELAGKFGRSYVPGRSWKALAEGLLKVHTFKTVADLGAGEGTLAQLMAKRAEKVIAVDHSPKMVAFGTKLAKQHDLPNLEYRLGDIEELPIDTRSVDLAVFSQALHHAADPGKAIAEAFRILKKGGHLIVLDLLQHGFEKARELYADTHLGFAEVELGDLLEAAGFRDVETAIVDREPEPPHFQTLLGVAAK